MGLEHAYIKWIRRRVVKTPKSGCCGLVSLVSFIIGCAILPKVFFEQKYFLDCRKKNA